MADLYGSPCASTGFQHLLHAGKQPEESRQHHLQHTHTHYQLPRTIIYRKLPSTTEKYQELLRITNKYQELPSNTHGSQEMQSCFSRAVIMVRECGFWMQGFLLMSLH